jgi:hypothetical protein
LGDADVENNITVLVFKEEFPFLVETTAFSNGPMGDGKVEGGVAHPYTAIIHRFGSTR